MFSQSTHQMRTGQVLPRLYTSVICQHGESNRYRFNSHCMNNTCTCRLEYGVRVRASKIQHQN